MTVPHRPWTVGGLIAAAAAVKRRADLADVLSPICFLNREL
jgi:hypothetical protein